MVWSGTPLGSWEQIKNAEDMSNFKHRLVRRRKTTSSAHITTLEKSTSIQKNPAVPDSDIKVIMVS